MANEIFDGTDVICQFLGEGKRLPHQARDSLSDGAVESLDVIGNAPLLVDDPMLMHWNHTLICTPAIGIERGMLTVALGYGLPQRFGTLATSVANMECDDLPTVVRRYIRCGTMLHRDGYSSDTAGRHIQIPFR